MPRPSWLEVIRRLTGGNCEPVVLCRDQRDGSLVVAKTWHLNVFDEVEEPENVTLYRRLPRHERIIKPLEFLSHCPGGRDYTVVYEWCNAGSLSDLRRHAEYEKEPLPEVFLWHMIAQVLEGLQVCAAEGVSHSDLHSGNVFLHFPGPIEENWPRAVLGDFGEAIEGWTIEYSLRNDLVRFFLSVLTMLHCVDVPKQRRSTTSQYSKSILEWVGLIAGQSLSLLPPEFSEVMRELYPRIPSYVESCKGKKVMPLWMVSYFKNLQKHAEMCPVESGQAGTASIEILSSDSIPEGQPCKRSSSSLGGMSERTLNGLGTPSTLSSKLTISDSDSGCKAAKFDDSSPASSFTEDIREQIVHPLPEPSIASEVGNKRSDTDSRSSSEPSFLAGPAVLQSANAKIRDLDCTDEEMTSDSSLSDEMVDDLLRPPPPEPEAASSKAEAASAKGLLLPDLTVERKALIAQLEAHFAPGASAEYTIAIERAFALRAASQDRKRLEFIMTIASEGLRHLTQ
ncbi:MAG: hypothetical protein LQ340_005298 [Diploschistes diacapsis]|nr:MAG: hypothetical protein LQ340_005298 [Diploschistes diacapsis]